MWDLQFQRDRSPSLSWWGAQQQMGSTTLEQQLSQSHSDPRTRTRKHTADGVSLQKPEAHLRGHTFNKVTPPNSSQQFYQLWNQYSSIRAYGGRSHSNYHSSPVDQASNPIKKQLIGHSVTQVELLQQCAHPAWKVSYCSMQCPVLGKTTNVFSFPARLLDSTVCQKRQPALRKFENDFSMSCNQSGASSAVGGLTVQL